MPLRRIENRTKVGASRLVIITQPRHARLASFSYSFYVLVLPLHFLSILVTCLYSPTKLSCEPTSRHLHTRPTHQPTTSLYYPSDLACDVRTSGPPLLLPWRVCQRTNLSFIASLSQRGGPFTTTTNDLTSLVFRASTDRTKCFSPSLTLTDNGSRLVRRCPSGPPPRD